ncbi:MAG: ferrochelatase [Methylococcaceae bacterium]
MNEHSSQDRWGILLVNLGTPDAPTPAAVKRYLGEFLSDSRVVEIPKPVWWMILNLFILPFRSHKSAHAYASIWTESGSPLMVLSQNLTKAVAERLAGRYGDRVHVDLAMCYGSRSIPAQMAHLRTLGVSRFLLLPLYPQYSSASTGAVFDAMAKALLRWRHVPEIHYIDHYHAHPAYIQAISQQVKTFWSEQGRGPFLLMSFHGLPEVSRSQGDPYHDQCITTARLLAEALELGEHEWQVCFQSRFGPARWLQPYCIDVLKAMPERGIKEVDLVCPGFAVDCLETLEEIAITNKEEFMAAGGTQYRYIPALNDAPAHVDLMEQLVMPHLG